jgi:hypothetical protein
MTMNGPKSELLVHTSSNIIASRSPKQILQQDICQKYGWSCTVTTSKIPFQNPNEEELPDSRGQDQVGTVRVGDLNPAKTLNNSTKITIGKNNEVIIASSTVTPCKPDIQYVCNIAVGYQTNYTFTSNVSEIDVYQQAIHGLQVSINKEEQKPVLTLQEFLSTLHCRGTTGSIATTDLQPWTIPIYDSHDLRNWDYFWSHRPNVVGMDTEGNNCIPPIIVQIAVIDSPNNETYCIIEAPQRRGSRGSRTATPAATLSHNLQRLLNDTSIVKVFCDNFAHKDKVALGIHVASSSLPDTNNEQRGQCAAYGFQSEPQSSIIDLECVMNEMYGPVKVARGLSRIMSLTIAPHVQISKSSASPTPNNMETSKTASSERWKNIKKFALIEQGKIKPISNIFRGLSPTELQYAACDAYATLLVYNYLFLKK